MFRAILRTVTSFITLPIRIYRRIVAAIIGVRRFIDERRRHLCVAILAAMMVVVGVKLRQPGESDAKLSGYVTALFEHETSERSEPAAPVQTATTEDTSNVPKPNISAARPQTTQRTAFTASNAVPRVTDASASPVPTVHKPRLILPEPREVDLTEFDDLLRADDLCRGVGSGDDGEFKSTTPPQAASLVGTIEDAR